MGVVYLAKQQDLGRNVALKVISPQSAGDVLFRERFSRESRLAAAIDHPNAVPLYSAGEDQGRLFLVMRYVNGTDLRSALQQEGSLSPGRASRICSQVAAALDAAHACGLVHRDVKPANVLLTGESPDEHAYLSDFGLTKDVDSQSSLTQSGHWIGTVDYAAPEQLDAARVDARTDVYALGVVLFEMVSGRVPFGGTLSQKIGGHIHGAIPSLRDLNPGVARAFDPVLERALAKDPTARYPSAGDLGRAALAAERGDQVTVPERSVATGGAAPSAVTTPMRARSPAAAAPAVTRVDNNPPPKPLETKVQRKPRPTVVLIILAVLALGVAAAVLLGTGVGGEDEPEPEPSSDRASSAQIDRPPRRPRARTPTAPESTPPPRTTPAPRPRPTPPSGYRTYTAARAGFAAEVPTGPGWSVGAMTNENTASNPRWHLEIHGPGVEIWIESTPADSATGPSSGVTSRTLVEHPAFGEAAVYEFSTSSSPCTSGCVDYVMQSGPSSGFAVLGGGSNTALAQEVAETVAMSLGYYDI